MHTPGLTNAPTTKTLLIALLTTSIALSILDAKHLASNHISPHLWRYAQFWRCLVWQVAGFANSTEALFAAMLVYCCRVVERGWGGRKYSSFIISILPYTTILPPLLLAILLRPLSWGYLNYLPSGPTALVFALLAQYYASIPHTFRFRLATSSSAAASSGSKPSQNPTAAGDTSTNTNTNSNPAPGPSSYTTLLLSDKSTTYLVATQLALSQFPAMLLPAAVGWFTGLAWRADVLPGVGPSAGFGFGFGRGGGAADRVGRGRRGSGRRFEDLRRRLEGEVVAASGSGQGQGQGQGDGQVQRRNAGGGFMERLRGAF